MTGRYRAPRPPKVDHWVYPTGGSFCMICWRPVREHPSMIAFLIHRITQRKARHD